MFEIFSNAPPRCARAADAPLRARGIRRRDCSEGIGASSRQQRPRRGQGMRAINSGASARPETRHADARDGPRDRRPAAPQHIARSTTGVLRRRNDGGNHLRSVAHQGAASDLADFGDAIQGHDGVLQIARELNVDAVLEGSAHLIGERVQSERTTDPARDQETLWSNSYDREVEDVLNLQSSLQRLSRRKSPCSSHRVRQATRLRAAGNKPRSISRVSEGRHSTSRIARGVELWLAARSGRSRSIPAWPWHGAALADCQMVRAVRGSRLMQKQAPRPLRRQRPGARSSTLARRGPRPHSGFPFVHRTSAPGNSVTPQSDRVESRARVCAQHSCAHADLAWASRRSAARSAESDRTRPAVALNQK